MTKRTPLIAGNWKMNLDHMQAIALIQKLCWTLNDADHDYRAVEVAVFPPFTDLRSAQTLIDAEKFEISLGAQDISKHDSGAFTGEVSGAFLAKLACKFVLIGHSERRQNHAETDEVVQAEDVSKAIRKAITENFGAESGQSRILYGGSVKANNVAGFLASGEVDGVLVGGASLDADEFAGISRFQKHIVL